jgi:two-component system response regulator AtoC
MLLHTVLAVENPSVRKKLQQLTHQRDTIVTALQKKDLTWEDIIRETGDLILISRALIPEPFSRSVGDLRQTPESPAVVILSDREDPEERASLLAAGCEAVLYTGLSSEKLMNVLTAILIKRREMVAKVLVSDGSLLRPRLSDFVSVSASMQAFLTIVRRVVAMDVQLLILGETGVGKEWLARAIHAESLRSQGPFIAVNCGALPETLLESELFGHQEGAFTGANRSHRGFFELAHRGTIFLDEIGDMPYHLQVKLLRVLQEHKIQRLGSEKPIALDVRVIAASNRDLEAEVEARRSRQDLYYRLSVVTLTVPPLRERREDIPSLVNSYINHFKYRVNPRVEGIGPEALEALHEYSWPGNVRELINVIERAMILCNGNQITLRDLPESISGIHETEPRGMRFSPTSCDEKVQPRVWLQQPLRKAKKELVAEFERTYLRELLRSTEGRIGETARRAGIQPRSLFDKMKQYGLRKEDFRCQPTGKEP